MNQDVAQDRVDSRAKGMMRGKQIASVLALIAVAGGLVLAVRSLNGPPLAPKKVPPTVNIITDNRPPPPPPPADEKKPPKPVDRKFPTPTTEIETTAPPAQKPTVIEGPATDKTGPLGGGVVSNDPSGEFGTGASQPGGGNGINRVVFASYTRLLQRHIQDTLARNQQVKQSDYRVTVRIWLSPEGVIQRAELDDSSGDTEVDGALRTALTALPALRERRPDNMPQPIRLRISNRSTG